MLKFNIPNHEEDLKIADELLKKIHNKIHTIVDNKQALLSLTKNKKEAMLILSTNVLYAIGDLSIPIFELRLIIESAYAKHYLKTPALGKKLYLEHYEGLHKPYDRLKNRAFKLIQLIDPTNEGIEEEIYV